jgi:hypothetical protein
MHHRVEYIASTTARAVVTTYHRLMLNSESATVGCRRGVGYPHRRSQRALTLYVLPGTVGIIGKLIAAPTLTLG